MRVAIINSVCGFGSTGKLSIDFSNYLIKKGHESIVFFGRKMKKQKRYENCVCFASTLSVLLHALLSRLFDCAGFLSFFATKKLIKLLERYAPDLVFINNIHGYYVNAKMLVNYLKESKTKTVWTFHDCWPFTGHCSHFEPANCDKWKTQCRKCPQKKKYPASFLFDFSKLNFIRKKRLLGNFNFLIISPSFWMQDNIKNSFLSDHKVVVIPNGIDKDIFREQEHNYFSNLFPNKIIVLGVASVWNKEKGLDDFCKLSKILPEKYKIVLVGVKKGQIKEYPNIFAIERTEDQNELANIYSSSHVFLNLTYADTFPTVNLEALSCGLPVFSYDTGGSTELVTKNFISKKGDINSVASFIKKEEYLMVNVTKRKIISKEEQFDLYLKCLEDFIYGN
ncbi:MAG: glycosyltransferase [Bacilli bacterium]|nr:glycosyltransferase [Bacilli bacterium]